MSDIPTIHVALAAAKAATGAVAKKERNTQQNFNFRGVDAVVNAAAGPLNDHGIIVLPEVIDYTYETVEIGKNRTQMAHVVGKVRYTFSGPDGSSVAATVLSEAMDSGDKCVAKFMSVAYRIALIQVLNLPTDDRDPDADTYERSAKPTVEELVTKTAGLSTVEDLRKHWAAVGAAGYLNTDIFLPGTGEKLKFQDYLKQRVDEVSTKSSTPDPGETTRPGGSARRPAK